MRHTIPNSPFATRLSGSVKETELRIRNIFQWKKKRPPVILVVLAALTVLFCCGLVSCQFREDQSDPDGFAPNTPAPTGTMDLQPNGSADVMSTEEKQIILDYFREEYQRERVYFLGEEPGEPREGDWRIDSISYAGETGLYETQGVAYEIVRRTYATRAGVLEWQEPQSGYFILTRSSYDGTLEQILGSPNFSIDGMAVETMIQQMAWGLMDLEVSLWRDGYAQPAGPGSQVPFFQEAYDGLETVEVLEDWEPIYWEGDYWANHSWENFEALCYHSASEGGYSVNTIDTTRSDLRTYRGVRVGESRKNVLETYPELKSGDYWGRYPGEDYLWYCNNELDLGPALLFFFENDAVNRIVLIDMFD